MAFLQSGGQNYDIKLVLFKPKVSLYFKWSWEMKKNKINWSDNIIQRVVQQKKIVLKCTIVIILQNIAPILIG